MFSAGSASAEEARFRPPAVPLVACDPYFSVWSASDQLTKDWSRHWTGAIHAMCGMVRIDGKSYRFAGMKPDCATLEQKFVSVLPTRTIYDFSGAGVALKITFLTPALPKKLDIYARPVTYVCWEARAEDGAEHDVSLYLDVTGEWVVNNPDQEIAWSRYKVSGMDVMRIGSAEQPILKKRGDDMRIDWGHLYLAAPRGTTRTAIVSDDAARNAFAASGDIPDSDDLRMPRRVNDQWPVMAFCANLGKIGEKASAGHAILAYDDVYSIEYMERRLRPYWRRTGMNAGDLIAVSEREFEALSAECAAFDAEVMGDLEKAGGREYALLCALAYRQCIAAHKLAADFDGTPMLFSKECFSNGCIATVDVSYPSAPFFMLFNNDLLKAMIRPVLDYAASARWPHPFAPHDLGTYPLANGQVYGDGEHGDRNQMPVEESGNMLIMIAAMAKIEGNADFAQKYWPTLTKWAEFLLDKGYDPENQLCTDDFAGHLAHNTNLSIKAIMGLASYAMLCDMTGRKDDSARFMNAAREMAQKWVKEADDGDHFRLAFDKPGTWSQKYNLVWDTLLGFNIFPPEVARKEIAFYKKTQNKYGIPLDNRSDYTKLDWVIWTATLADSQADFEAIADPAYAFANEGPDRVPLSDWYWTSTAKVRGFRARSVIGGVFIKMLKDEAAWRKWAGKK